MGFLDRTLGLETARRSHLKYEDEALQKLWCIGAYRKSNFRNVLINDDFQYQTASKTRYHNLQLE